MTATEPALQSNKSFFTTDSHLGWRDRLGAWRVRWGIGRNNYRVAPGLYALGSPDRQSSVLVTANYKMSFDELRRHLSGRDLWILVLDTKGVNVWCAAGKGSFGTKELVQRISQTGLAKLVDTRVIILPQLGASGVQAHIVKAWCGFKVRFGPVRAADLPAYLDSGLQKSSAMAEVAFSLVDRAVLAPVEFTQTIKFWPVLAAVALLLALPLDPGWLGRAGFFGLSWLGAIVLACFAFPVLLPWLPGKAFSVKSLWLGLPFVAATLGLALYLGFAPPDLAWMAATAGALGVAAIVYLSMNFTGSTTFTNQSGALSEVKLAMPFLLTVAGLGLATGIVRVVLACLGKGV